MSRFASIAEVMADLQKRAMKNCQNQQESGELTDKEREESQQEYENNIEWLGEDA